MDTPNEVVEQMDTQFQVMMDCNHETIKAINDLIELNSTRGQESIPVRELKAANMDILQRTLSNFQIALNKPMRGK